jgi:23S rRNA pseudouridine2605 synthase
LSVRLNKFLAQRGVGARRKCDALVQQGAVRVNGRLVQEPGFQVEPERDTVTVEGKPLAAAPAPRYFVLNKPVGIITTLEDPEGRRTVREFLPPGPRLFPVGRLDADTSGLLLLTNDGELAHRLMHPRYGVSKIYRVRVEPAPSAEALRRLQEGVEFEPGVRSAPARARVLEREAKGALVQIELHEGRYRQVRRMCEAVGLAVRSLHRSAYGPLRLGPVPRGMWRELSEDEVSSLRAASARPRVRGQAGYHSPRAGGDPVARLARRLERLAAGETSPLRPAQRPGERVSRPPEGRRSVERVSRPPEGRRSGERMSRPPEGRRSGEGMSRRPEGRRSGGRVSRPPEGRRPTPSAGGRRTRQTRGPAAGAVRGRVGRGARAVTRGRGQKPRPRGRADSRGRPAARRGGSRPR